MAPAKRSGIGKAQSKELRTMMLNQENIKKGKGFPITVPTETVSVDTRFGVYEFTPQNTVVMPQGLVGFADHQLFGLANLPEPAPDDFKLLQSLGELPLSFIVMPVTPAQAPIGPADVEEACSAAGVLPETAVFLFVVTIRPKADGVGIEMTTNLRAPIVFDPNTRLARQHVLSNSQYPLRHPIEKWDGEA
jgi:flagellar assembly factor FliW